jgi:glucosamine-6-phosphate deaminase
MLHDGKALRTFEAGLARVAIYQSSGDAGRAGASRAAQLIQAAIAEKGRARVIGATGNSQIPLVTALVSEDIDWSAVELFHMDEYIGLPETHPSSFHYWMRTRLAEKVQPSKMHYLNGNASDIAAEIARYAGLLNEAPIDMAFVGFGENGHIAFNDPLVANFEDPETLKVITLDDACRQQQAGEGHFPDVASVPREAVTITCSGLFRAASWICCVPERRKAHAVQAALEHPVSTRCPASLAQTHPDTHVYLDCESAAELSQI